MEKRKFGRTGLQTSLLGFGGFHLLEIPAKEAEFLVNTYLDEGGNYIETAASYGDGESERKIGRVIAKRRQECILVTKTGERKEEGAMQSIERSLSHLKTDYVDVLMMHAVGTPEELHTLLGPRGAMEAAVKAQAQGKIGHIGISMHGQGDILIEALNSYPFDAVMTTINYYDRCNFPEIEDTLVPLAQQKETAIILMKPVGDGMLYRNPEMAFRYAMSTPASVVVAGMNTRELLYKDLSYAKQFKPLSETEREKLFQEANELGDYVCRQCDKCIVCPEGINIKEVFKYEGYFDRQMRDGRVRDAAEFALRDRLRFWFGNQKIAQSKYDQLSKNASHCNKCGMCSSKCPYGIDIINKMSMVDYKLGKALEF